MYFVCTKWEIFGDLRGKVRSGGDGNLDDIHCCVDDRVLRVFLADIAKRVRELHPAAREKNAQAL